MQFVRKLFPINIKQFADCDLCNQWIHIKCNDLNDLDYNLLKSKNEIWYCILCTVEILPFCTVSSIMSLQRKFNKPASAMVNLMSQQNITYGQTDNKLKLPNCKYRNIHYFQKLQKEDVDSFSHEYLFTY